jgi:hypothetical protein
MPRQRAPWFRFYSRVLHDPKVQGLSGTDFKAWINLLCLANEADPRGSLPSDADVGFALRIPAAKAGLLLARFHEFGLLDLDEEVHRVVVHDWHEWQFKSDNEADNKADYRRRQNRTTSRTTAGQRTGQHMDMSDARDQRSETEEETETDQIPPVVPPKRGDRVKGKGAREARNRMANPDSVLSQISRRFEAVANGVAR